MDRSPTAEALFSKSKKYKVKSAGTHPLAINPVSQKMIDWADIVFVMNEREDKHLTYLRNNFNLEKKAVYDLDIPDIYRRGDPKLVKLIKEKLKRLMAERES